VSISLSDVTVVATKAVAAATLPIRILSICTQVQEAKVSSGRIEFDNVVVHAEGVNWGANQMLSAITMNLGECTASIVSLSNIVANISVANGSGAEQAILTGIFLDLTGVPTISLSNVQVTIRDAEYYGFNYGAGILISSVACASHSVWDAEIDSITLHQIDIDITTTSRVPTNTPLQALWLNTQSADYDSISITDYSVNMNHAAAQSAAAGTVGLNLLRMGKVDRLDVTRATLSFRHNARLTPAGDAVMQVVGWSISGSVEYLEFDQGVTTFIGPSTYYDFYGIFLELSYSATDLDTMPEPSVTIDRWVDHGSTALVVLFLPRGLRTVDTVTISSAQITCGLLRIVNSGSDDVARGLKYLDIQKTKSLAERRRRARVLICSTFSGPQRSPTWNSF
jgi:hypothetical protein